MSLAQDADFEGYKSFYWGQMELQVDCNLEGLGSDPSTLVHGLWENNNKMGNQRNPDTSESLH